MKKFVIRMVALLATHLLLLGVCIFWASRSFMTWDEYAAGFTRQLPKTPPSPMPAANPQRHTIVTYNVGYASGLTNNSGSNASKEEYAQNIQTIITALGKVNPDIVAMQEVDFDSARSYGQDQPLLFSEGLGLTYRACEYTWALNYVPFPYGLPSHNFGRILSGQCIASRYPLEKFSKVTMPKPEENPFWYNLFYLDRIIQMAEITIDSHRLVIVNVHLEAYKRKTREAQAAIVAAMLGDYADRPLILLGDFNARPPWQTDEPTIATILAVPGMHKEIPKETYEAEGERTFYTSNSGHPTKTIDHIFYNDKIKCINAKVLKDAGTGSDHLPVMMEFEFN